LTLLVVFRIHSRSELVNNSSVHQFVESYLQSRSKPLIEESISLDYNMDRLVNIHIIALFRVLSTLTFQWVHSLGVHDVPEALFYFRGRPVERPTSQRKHFCAKHEGKRRRKARRQQQRCGETAATAQGSIRLMCMLCAVREGTVHDGSDRHNWGFE
jgi:hypothetical protein